MVPAHNGGILHQFTAATVGYRIILTALTGGGAYRSVGVADGLNGFLAHGFPQ